MPLQLQLAAPNSSSSLSSPGSLEENFKPSKRQSRLCDGIGGSVRHLSSNPPERFICLGFEGCLGVWSTLIRVAQPFLKGNTLGFYQRKLSGKEVSCLWNDREVHQMSTFYHQECTIAFSCFSEWESMCYRQSSCNHRGISLTVEILLLKAKKRLSPWWHRWPTGVHPSSGLCERILLTI